MAVVHGYDNHWLQQLARKRAGKLVRVVIVVVTRVICASLVHPAIGFVVLLAGVRAYLKQLRRWRYAHQGAKGELETAALLAGLPGTFTVLNDVALGGYNADHVVVGPSGVWVVETKSQKGIVTEFPEGVRIDGRPMYRDPRRQARGCAAEIARLTGTATGIRCWVEAIVCFPRADVQTNGSPTDTCVVGRQQLLARLQWGMGRLAPDQCARVSNALLALKTHGSEGHPGAGRPDPRINASRC